VYAGKGKYPNNLIPVILPAYTTCKDGTECFETSAHKIQTPGSRPKGRIQHLEQGESLKSRSVLILLFFVLILSFLSKLIRLLVTITLIHYYTTAVKHDD
jgi:hypothetical protein